MDLGTRHQELPAGTRVTPAIGPPEPAEWIASGEGERTIMYLHGGAFVAGSLDAGRPVAAQLAAWTGARVLSAHYRLAPEAAYPASTTDALAAYRWLLETEAPSTPAAVVGLSAGGGIALGMLQRARDAGDPLPSAMVLMSPWLDLSDSAGSRARFADADPVITPDLLKTTANAYLGGREARDASPLWNDLTGLPPTLVQVGAEEVLVDDALRLGNRAREAGVEIAVEIWNAMPHAWHEFAIGMTEGERTYDRIAAWLAIVAS